MGFRLMDGGPNCVAGDILIFAQSRVETSWESPGRGGQAIGSRWFAFTSRDDKWSSRMRPNLPRPFRPHLG